MNSESSFSSIAWVVRAAYGAALLIGALALDGYEIQIGYHLSGEAVPLWDVPRWIAGDGVTAAQHAGVIACSIVTFVLLSIAAQWVIAFDYGFGIAFGPVDPFVRWVVRQMNWWPNFPSTAPSERMGDSYIRTHDRLLRQRRSRQNERLRAPRH